LNSLANLHMEELKRIQLDLGKTLKAQPRFIKPDKGA
jgi:hypothetical protein